MDFTGIGAASAIRPAQSVISLPCGPARFSGLGGISRKIHPAAHGARRYA